KYNLPKMQAHQRYCYQIFVTPVKGDNGVLVKQPHLGGNPSTSFMLIFALIGGVMGASSMLAGFFHLRKWTSHSLASAASSAIISWAITALAFGGLRPSLINVFDQLMMQSCLQADNNGRSPRKTPANFGSVDHHSYGESITLYTTVARWDFSQQVWPCLWFLWTSALARSTQVSLGPALKLLLHD
ncbi:hypothetical protein MTR67_010189, partial [Solanum verrucosum]